jgi:hypothetical protein
MRFRSLGLLTCLVAACSSSTSDSTNRSESPHTAGELTWKNEPFSWTTMSQEEVDPLLGQTSAPATHAITTRLQDWVDRFDTAVRSIVQEKTGQKLVAPKPKVRVVVDANVNAYIMGLPFCLASAAAPGPDVKDVRVFATPTRFQDNLPVCLDANGWPASPAPVDWFNSLGGMKLQAKADAIEIDTGSYPLRVAKVGVMSAVALVNVNAGFVAALGEKSAVVSVAHELGHYYRSHMATASSSHYSFWFDDGQHAPKRPLPVADHEQYEKDYERLKEPRFVVSGQKFHARIGSTLVAWASQMRNTTVPAGHACERMKKESSAWPDGVLDELTVGTNVPLTDSARKAYLALEKAAAPCIDNVTLTDDPTTAPWGADNRISRQWFVDAVDQPLVSAGLTSRSTLEQLVEDLTTSAKALDAEVPVFVKRLTDNKIGLYTTEQEADDISMELATRVGLTKDDVFTSYLDLMKFIEKAAPAADAAKVNGPLSAKDCEALLTKGFKDGDRDVYIPLGSLEDPHHSTCYRIFNLYRESEAHQYTVATANLPDPTPSWGSLQKQAIELLDSAQSSSNGSGSGKGSTTGDDDDDGSPLAPPGGDSDSTGGSGFGATDRQTTKTTTTTTTASCNVSLASRSDAGGIGALGVALATLLFARRSSRRKTPRGRA